MTRGFQVIDRAFGVSARAIEGDNDVLPYSGAPYDAAVDGSVDRGFLGRDADVLVFDTGRLKTYDKLGSNSAQAVTHHDTSDDLFVIQNTELRRLQRDGTVDWSVSTAGEELVYDATNDYICTVETSGPTLKAYAGSDGTEQLSITGSGTVRSARDSHFCVTNSGTLAWANRIEDSSNDRQPAIWAWDIDAGTYIGNTTPSAGIHYTGVPSITAIGNKIYSLSNGKPVESQTEGEDVRFDRYDDGLNNGASTVLDGNETHSTYPNPPLQPGPDGNALYGTRYDESFNESKIFKFDTGLNSKWSATQGSHDAPLNPLIDANRNIIFPDGIQFQVFNEDGSKVGDVTYDTSTYGKMNWDDGNKDEYLPPVLLTGGYIFFPTTKHDYIGISYPHANESYYSVADTAGRPVQQPADRIKQ